MKILDIVLQGPVWKTTVDTAKYYLELPFVNKVIISTWDDEPINQYDENGIEVIKSNKPVNGTGNMNYQIVSSFEGIKKTESKLIAKMRSDQIIHKDSMNYLNDFITDNIDDTDLIYSDGSKRKGNVFVIGMNKIFPFHPQDHIFWGYREDVYRVFNIPLKPARMKRDTADFTKEVRCNIYLGAMYFKQFYPEVEKYIDNFEDYLVDNPKKLDALIMSEKTRDKVFKVLPKFSMFWEKYKWDAYPYSWYGSMGEYYYEDLK
jgi:hypothetical protein